MEEKRVILSFWSFVLIGVTIGICSGVFVGAFVALAALFSGEFVSALIAIPATALGNAVSVGVSAALGFIVYKPLVARFYKLGILSGRFEHSNEPGDVAFAEFSSQPVKSGGVAPPL